MIAQNFQLLELIAARNKKVRLYRFHIDLQDVCSRNSVLPQLIFHDYLGYDLGVSVIKLKDESCSSRGYRMAETKSECEDIAQRLGLLNTEATSLDIADCNNQGFYRCAYDSPTKLFWIPNCADNGTYGTNVENLCVSGN